MRASGNEASLLTDSPLFSIEQKCNHLEVSLNLENIAIQKNEEYIYEYLITFLLDTKQTCWTGMITDRVTKAYISGFFIYMLKEKSKLCMLSLYFPLNI